MSNMEIEISAVVTRKSKVALQDNLSKEEIDSIVKNHINFLYGDTCTEYEWHKNLLPCPFCGGNGHHITIIPDLDSISLHAIRCENCNAEVGAFTTVEEAEERWNTRVSEEQNENNS